MQQSQATLSGSLPRASIPLITTPNQGQRITSLLSQFSSSQTGIEMILMRWQGNSSKQSTLAQQDISLNFVSFSFAFQALFISISRFWKFPLLATLLNQPYILCSSKSGALTNSQKKCFQVGFTISFSVNLRTLKLHQSMCFNNARFTGLYPTLYSVKFFMLL